jgi:undecaprenyl-diphosphatase
MTYVQAILIALVQGVTELFPVSSLGHSVLLPAWLGGSWQTMVEQSSQATSESSFYLAYIVALHVATAIALLWFFRADWVRIIGGFVRSVVRSVRERRFSVVDTDERLAWLIIIATIPVGLTGVVLEHTLRTLFAKPLSAAIFLTINGLVLFAGDRLRRRVAEKAPAAQTVEAETPAAAGSGPRAGEHVAAAAESDHRLAALTYRDALYVGLWQIPALLAGISRSGATMVGGLTRGLSNEDAARFAFLLATPVILAAGALKLPSLAGPAGAHIHGQIVVGMIVAGVAAYLSTRFLIRYFATRTLTPFAIYCLVAGAASILRFTIG